MVSVLLWEVCWAMGRCLEPAIICGEADMLQNWSYQSRSTLLEVRIPYNRRLVFDLGYRDDDFSPR